MPSSQPTSPTRSRAGAVPALHHRRRAGTNLSRPGPSAPRAMHLRCLSLLPRQRQRPCTARGGGSPLGRGASPPQQRTNRQPNNAHWVTEPRSRASVAKQGTGHSSHVPQHAPPCGRARGWLPKKCPPQGSLIQHDTTTNRKARTGGHGAPIKGVGRQARSGHASPDTPARAAMRKGKGGATQKMAPPSGPSSSMTRACAPRNHCPRRALPRACSKWANQAQTSFIRRPPACHPQGRRRVRQGAPPRTRPRSSGAHQRATFRAVAVCARERRHVPDATRSMRRHERHTHHRTCTPRCSRRRPEAAAVTTSSRRRYQQGGTGPCGDLDRG